MNPALLQPFLIMGGMWALRKYVDLADPNVIVLFRVLYGVVHVAIAGAFLLIHSKAGGNRSEEIVIHKKPLGPMEQAKKKAAEAEGQTYEEDPGEPMTVASYDQMMALTALKGMLMPIGITMFIHYKWAVVPPLLLQAVMTPIRHFKNPLIQVYLFGKAAEGELARPFKAPAKENPFAAMMEQPKADDDNKTVDNAKEDSGSEEDVVVVDKDSKKKKKKDNVTRRNKD